MEKIKRILTEDEQQETLKAVALHAKLDETFKNKSVLVPYAIARNSGRKEFAKAVRSLFKKLGLKGISVTTPNYSMASTIDIRLPRRKDYLDYNKMCLDWDSERQLRDKDIALTMNYQAEKLVEEIISICFPTKNDRSETITDYYDYKWSVN